MLFSTMISAKLSECLSFKELTFFPPSVPGFPCCSRFSVVAECGGYSLVEGLGLVHAVTCCRARALEHLGFSVVAPGL